MHDGDSSHGVTSDRGVEYTLTCSDGDDKDAVTKEVVGHASAAHGHSLDRHVVFAHLAGLHPYDRDDS